MSNADADALRLAVAFRVAFGAPDPLDGLVDALSRAVTAPRATTRPSITAGQKRAAFDRYEALRAQHREITGRGYSIIPAGGQRPAVFASAAPDDRGPSPLIRAMYGLD